MVSMKGFIRKTELNVGLVVANCTATNMTSKPNEKRSLMTLCFYSTHHLKNWNSRVKRNKQRVRWGRMQSEKARYPINSSSYCITGNCATTLMHPMYQVCPCKTFFTLWNRISTILCLALASQPRMDCLEYQL